MPCLAAIAYSGQPLPLLLMTRSSLSQPVTAAAQLLVCFALTCARWPDRTGSSCIAVVEVVVVVAGYAAMQGGRGVLRMPMT